MVLLQRGGGTGGAPEGVLKGKPPGGEQCMPGAPQLPSLVSKTFSGSGDDEENAGVHSQGVSGVSEAGGALWLAGEIDTDKKKDAGGFRHQNGAEFLDSYTVYSGFYRGEGNPCGPRALGSVVSVSVQNGLF